MLAIAAAWDIRQESKIVEFATEHGVDLTPEEVARRKTDLRRERWISEQIMETIPRLMGYAYAALFGIVLRGEQGATNAARILLTRFDRAYRPTSRSEVARVNVNVGQVPDSDVTRILLEKIREIEGIDGRKGRPTQSLPSPDASQNREIRPGDEGTTSSISC